MKRRAKQAAVRGKKGLKLARLKGRAPVRGTSVVEETRGAIKVSKKLVDAVLAEEGLYGGGRSGSRS